MAVSHNHPYIGSSGITATNVEMVVWNMLLYMYNWYKPMSYQKRYDMSGAIREE